MLDLYFKYPDMLRRMRRGPFRAAIDTIASDLEGADYARLAARHYLI